MVVCIVSVGPSVVLPLSPRVMRSKCSQMEGMLLGSALSMET